MSDTPSLVLPQPSVSNVNVLTSMADFLGRVMDIEIRDNAPTIHADKVVISWMTSVVIQDEVHPLTQEVTLKPGIMLSMWIGPNDDGQAIGVNPIMDQIYALSDRAEVAKFLRFCLAAIEASYVAAKAQGIAF